MRGGRAFGMSSGKSDLQLRDPLMKLYYMSHQMIAYHRPHLLCIRQDEAGSKSAVLQASGQRLLLTACPCQSSSHPWDISERILSSHLQLCLSFCVL